VYVSCIATVLAYRAYGSIFMWSMHQFSCSSL